MYENNLKVSIITVCLNSEMTIEQTIQSVINQTYSNIEYIIIDGKSTDRTLEILNKYMDRISILVSEKDEGIYDAMNKGLKLATGDIIYFLNSGDYLYHFSTIEKIVSLFAKDDLLKVVYGDVIHYDERTKKEYYASSHIPNRNALFIKGTNQQAMFAKKCVFNKFGNFDLKYSIFADYDWFLKIVLKHGVKSYYYNSPVCFYLMGGVSGDGAIKYDYERYEIIKKYGGTNLILIRCRLYGYSYKYLPIIKKFLNRYVLGRYLIDFYRKLIRFYRKN